MPLQEIHQSGTQSGWAIWHITENVDQFANKIIGTPPAEITHESKRLEWLAARHLVLSLSNHLGLRYFGVKKDAFGKPFFEKYPHHLSLSHSFPYVAAQLDHDQPVGIDLEQPKEKILKIAPRIFSREEQTDAGSNVIKHTVYWCAKEAMYKIHGKGNLYFSNQLNIEPFLLQEEGSLKGIISSEKKVSVNLDYRVEPDYVLVRTKNFKP
ncbi:MAG TPA: 4'-phosphopantetheinyl transferase superfamily protein [Cyclobacteriaceae bacterium]|nr:4'-phosphopantetheinyl transferase superfamily protein [Cyclobacteriaceae bacterium]